MPSKLLRAVCLFFSRPDHYPQRPQRLVEVARVQNKNSLNGAIWSNSLFSLCQGTTPQTQSSYYFLPFTITLLQQGAQQRWLICTCAATMCRKTHQISVWVLPLPSAMEENEHKKHGRRWLSAQRSAYQFMCQNDCCHRFCCLNSVEPVCARIWCDSWLSIFFFFIICFLQSSRDYAS